MLTDDSLREGARYAVRQIRKICQELGPRWPGSEGERRCQELLRDELAAAGLSPSLEPFPVSATAFMAAPVIAGWLALAAIPCYWLTPVLSSGLLVAALGIIACEVGAYRHVLTPLFPSHSSCNLHAVLSPSGPVKRRIIVAGHADAACEWRYQERFPRAFLCCAIVAAASVAALLLISLATWVLHGVRAPTEGLWWYVGTGQFLCLPGAFIAATFTRFGVVVPGAVDNLTGAVLAVGLARQMHAAGLLPANTEVVFLVTGSEEAGLVGAEAFVRKHGARWRGVETVFVALESFREIEHLMVYDRDQSGLVRHDARVCGLLQNAMKDCGLDHPFGCVTVGATDAAAAARAGLPSAALVGMDPAPAHYYHCRRDSWEILDEDCLFKALQVVATALETYDRRGLPA